MADLEHDLYQNLDMTWNGWKTEINYEFSAKNLTKLGYQKIVWHVVKWDCVDWSDDNGVCYNVDYWIELPEIKLEK